MSIPLADELPPLWGWVLLVLLAAVSLGAMLILGAFARRDGHSVDRLFDRRSIGPLLLNAALSVVTYLGASFAVLIVLHWVWHLDLSKINEETISPTAMLVISLLVPLVTLATLLTGLKLFVAGGAGRIGLSNEMLKRSVLPAIGFIVAVLPFVFLISNLAEMIYRFVGWEHPAAHPLLKSMDEAGGSVAKLLAMLSAVVLAPLGEEILFRGHIQTSIRSLLSRLRFAPPVAEVPMASALIARDPQSTTGEVSPTEPMPLPVITYAHPLPPPRRAPASVVAVLITSLMFAGVHPGWSQPPIFVLSLFLGFAYERRGNLWTAILLHAMFNGIMLTAFLFMDHPPS